MADRTAHPESGRPDDLPAESASSAHGSAAAGSDEIRPGPVAWALQLPIRFYRVAISPVLPPSCRFHPSCSAYAVEALRVHGAARGLWLAARRLGRCGPWHPGGLDPVPPRRGSADSAAAEGDRASRTGEE